MELQRPSKCFYPMMINFGWHYGHWKIPRTLLFLRILLIQSGREMAFPWKSPLVWSSESEKTVYFYACKLVEIPFSSIRTCFSLFLKSILRAQSGLIISLLICEKVFFSCPNLQSFTKHLKQNLVFMWNSALRKKFNFCFSGDFC